VVTLVIRHPQTNEKLTLLGAKEIVLAEKRYCYRDGFKSYCLGV